MPQLFIRCGTRFRAIEFASISRTREFPVSRRFFHFIGAGDRGLRTDVSVAASSTQTVTRFTIRRGSIGRASVIKNRGRVINVVVPRLNSLASIWPHRGVKLTHLIAPRQTQILTQP